MIVLIITKRINCTVFVCITVTYKQHTVNTNATTQRAAAFAQFTLHVYSTVPSGNEAINVPVQDVYDDSLK